MTFLQKKFYKQIYILSYDLQVVCWSLLQLKDQRPDELIEANCFEAYRDVAQEFGPLVVTWIALTQHAVFSWALGVHSFRQLDTIAAAWLYQRTIWLNCAQTWVSSASAAG